MADHDSLNRRQFAQRGTVAMAAAGATGVSAAAQPQGRQSNGFPDEKQIQPVGGQSINTSGEKVPLAPPNDQPPDLKLPEIPKREFGWAVIGLGQLALG